jgi:hypothetical protein
MSSWKQQEHYYSENFYQPIERYLVQYKLLEERIAERNTRLVDMDRYSAEVKTLMTRPDTVPTRLQVAKDKAEAKRVEYTELNEELIRDVQALILDRSRFFDALFANVRTFSPFITALVSREHRLAGARTNRVPRRICRESWSHRNEL